MSPWLADEARPGDRFELRGPIGGYFTWSVAEPSAHAGRGRLGVVPLMAILRHRAASGDAGRAVHARLLYSARTVADIIYHQELQRLSAEPGGPEVSLTLTREQPPDGWKGFDRRIDAPMLAAAGVAPEMDPDVFVCGPTPMVEAVADALVGLGHEPARIRTERFGPTGEG